MSTLTSSGHLALDDPNRVRVILLTGSDPDAQYNSIVTKNFYKQKFFGQKIENRNLCRYWDENEFLLGIWATKKVFFELLLVFPEIIPPSIPGLFAQVPTGWLGAPRE